MSYQDTYRNYLLASTALLVVSFAATPQALAQEIDGTTGTETVITGGGASVTDADGGGFGAADVDGGDNVGTITIGSDDDTQQTSTIRVFDSAGGGDVLTVDGAVSVTQDTTTAGNTDILEFQVGTSDGGATDNLSSGITFSDNLDAGANGTININATDATNADAFVFNGDTINLGAGGITFTNASDSATLSGTNAQTLTGTISGGGDVVVDNANGVTFNGVIGGAALDTITIEKSGGNSFQPPLPTT